MQNIIPFPSHKIGLRPGDQIAIVTCVKNGRARTVKTSPQHTDEFPIFAHNDLIVALKIGDWVRVDRTSYGMMVIERLAQPGERPLPRAEYVNGRAYINRKDPAWRLYKD